MNAKDRRTAKRISYLCEVEWEGNGSRVNTRITDLSTNGAFIDSMTCFSVGSILKLKFRLQDVLIETTAEVRYCMQQIGMGVRFLSLRPEHVVALERLVEGKPVVQPEARAVSGPLLSGNFELVSLFDVIQMIENSRLTGALRLTLTGAAGEVDFNDGSIVSAQLGPHRDHDALSKLLGATEGAFEFCKSDTEFDRTIKADSNSALLLNLLRGKDQESAQSIRNRP